MAKAINYSDGSIPPEQDRQALLDLCDYLVAKGKYKDREAALRDADKRVAFLEKADIYADDPQMATASQEKKRLHALIAAHHLHGVLKANDGKLPDPKLDHLEEMPVQDDPPREAPASEGNASITNIFSSIELDMSTGLTREQIIAKLQESGVTAENAADAYAFVRKQRETKQRTRLVAAISLTVLIIILYFIAR